MVNLADYFAQQEKAVDEAETGFLASRGTRQQLWTDSCNYIYPNMGPRCKSPKAYGTAYCENHQGCGPSGPPSGGGYLGTANPGHKVPAVPGNGHR